MLNNDVLRSLRYLLDLPDAHLAELAAPSASKSKRTCSRLT